VGFRQIEAGLVGSGQHYEREDWGKGEGGGGVRTRDGEGGTTHESVQIRQLSRPRAPLLTPLRRSRSGASYFAGCARYPTLCLSRPTILCPTTQSLPDTSHGQPRTAPCRAKAGTHGQYSRVDAPRRQPATQPRHARQGCGEQPGNNGGGGGGGGG